MSSNQLLTIDQLDQENQKKAILGFIDFYVQLFKRSDLEIMTNFKVGNLVSDINDVLERNRYLSGPLLVQVSIHQSYQEYFEILQHLNQKFYETGNPEIDWSTWEQQQHDQLAVS
ncbi:hypothetical protein [Paucilactobacillus sp. N302-9]